MDTHTAPRRSPRFALLVVDHAGARQYVCEGADDEGPPVVFRSREKADAAAMLWREGLGDEVLSVSVVRAPTSLRRR